MRAHAAVIMVIAALAGCNAPAGEASAPRFADVHGLAVDPTNPDRVFVATHHGLYVGAGGSWERVGPEDDYMGFSAHPTDASVFWASGHPKEKTLEYHNLGVLKSVDGGRTWKRIALAGVDFHAMTVSPADPDHLWGAWQGKVQRSTDGGVTWTVVANAPAQLSSLAADPRDAETVYATTPTAVLRSVDGGATWGAWAPRGGYGLALGRGDDGSAFIASGGALLAARGNGTWEATSLDPAGGTLTNVAISASDPRVVYAATYEGAVHRSDDAGATWRLVKADE